MDTHLQFEEFEAAERAVGCSEVLARSWEANTEIAQHSHPFRARALVVEGEMWLIIDGQERRLLPGDRFDLPAGTPHAERYGPQGAVYWVARTNP